MNKENYSGLISAWILILVFSIAGFSSCKKNGPTKAVITVLDSTQKAVLGAKVTLWQDTSVNATNGVPSKVRVTKISDAAGKAEFDFELEAFLNVEAIKDLDTGRTFIKLKEHETVNQVVNL